jgi:predicted DNA binding CopG/RHH family protein
MESRQWAKAESEDLRASAAPAAAPSPAAAPYSDRKLKCASITIRLSRGDCAQLHQRAAEAGLTVSAYLRSCALEAESLRSLVKETMAQLRTATSPVKAACPAAARHSWFPWLRQFFTPWHTSQNVTRA